MTATRKQVREAFGALLSTELTGSGNPVQAVYDYVKADFGGMSPVVVVRSNGSARPRETFTGPIPSYQLEVLVFVLRTDDSDDYLDTVDQALADVIEANQTAATWRSVIQVGDSIIVATNQIGGAAYWLERFTYALQPTN